MNVIRPNGEIYLYVIDTSKDFFHMYIPHAAQYIFQLDKKCIPQLIASLQGLYEEYKSE